MKVVTNGYKTNLKSNGREISAKITYYINESSAELKNEDLISLDYRFESNILKSVMHELEFTTKTGLKTGTRLKFEFGIKVGNAYEYLDYGYFYIKEREYQRESKTYKYQCYDKMLDTMVNYPADGILELVPSETITLDNYIYELTSYLGMTFANYEGNYTNNDLVITADYWANNNARYTFRDVLDQIAEVVGGNLVINTNEELEIIYPTETNEIINGDCLTDINIMIGEKFGVINSVTCTRADKTDNVSAKDDESIAANGETDITLTENLMLEDNNRTTYLQNILQRLDGLYYTTVDVNTIGVPYLEVGDLYYLMPGAALQPRVGLHPSVGLTPRLGKYKCMMLGTALKIQNGFSQQLYSDKPTTATLDYVNSNATPLTDKNAQIIVDKKLGEVTISADQVNFESHNFDLTTNNITISSDKFSVDADGKMTCSSADITGGKVNITSQDNAASIWVNGTSTYSSYRSSMYPYQIRVEDGSYAATLRPTYLYVGGASGTPYGRISTSTIEGGDATAGYYISKSGFAIGSTNNTELSGSASSSDPYFAVIKASSGSCFYKYDGQHVSSDKRCKDNIEEIKEEQSINIINKLKPVTYTYKDQEKYHRGLIAQDVKEILKKEEIKDQIYEYEKATKRYSLNYTELIPDLINCIKYQQKQIEDLQNQINKLKKEGE